MILALAGLLQGCSTSAGVDDDTLVVFAASSLTEAFEALETAFERAHPGTDVQRTHAGSQILRLQLEQGARAEVIASANATHLDALRDQGLVQPPLPFATNELIVVVPGDRPDPIGRFEDLPHAERIVVGHPNVPIGAYTEQLLTQAGRALGESFEADVRDRIVSQESNVRLVRAKVMLGEADAAIVYRTDHTDGLQSVEIPGSLNVRATYAIGRVTEAAHPELAASFIDFVRSPQGQMILAAHGFRPMQAEAAPRGERVEARVHTPHTSLPRSGHD